MSFGTQIAAPISASRLRPVITQMGVCHSYARPSQEPSGTPITYDKLMPRKVSASALPRFAGSTTATAMPAAIGVNTAPRPISTRPAISVANEFDSAHSRLPSVNSASAISSARLRGQRPVANNTTGASSAVDSA